MFCAKLTEIGMRNQGLLSKIYAILMDLQTPSIILIS